MKISKTRSITSCFVVRPFALTGIGIRIQTSMTHSIRIRLKTFKKLKYSEKRESRGNFIITLEERTEKSQR